MTKRRNEGKHPEVPRTKLKWKYCLPESVGHSKGHATGKVYSYTCLHFLKNRDFSNKQPSDDLKLPENKNKPNPKLAFRGK
jgi:hypothetical protein